LKNINFIYLLAVLLLLLCLPFFKNKLKNSNEFFGIAENQIRNVNLEYPVEIIKIYKLQGESVQLGDTILKLRRVDLETKKQKVEFDKLEIEKRILLEKEEYLSAKSILENEKSELRKIYLIKYAELERNAKLQTELVSQVLNPNEISSNSNKFLLNDLQEKEKLDILEIDLKIKNLKNEFDARQNENQVRKNKLVYEISEIGKSEQSLDLICTEEGIIGQLEFNQGDKIQEYTSLLKIYSPHPNTVTIYIGDNQLSTLKLGDSVKISSLNTMGYTLTGFVVALGTRITALPERLKKIPELRAWGREVQIRIPAQNDLLQGEKVLVSID